jgi:hypothetical protein
MVGMVDGEGVPVEVEDDHPATGTGHPDHFLDRPGGFSVDVHQHAPAAAGVEGVVGKVQCQSVA